MKAVIAVVLCALFAALMSCEQEEAAWLCKSDQCDGGCVDLRADPRHCGACGRACMAGPNQVAVCDGGACNVTCATAYTSCETDGGCETNIRTSTRHCGRCGVACANPGTETPNTVYGCYDGECTRACASGYGDCDNNPINGCEVNTQSNVMNCGMCGRRCDLPNATAACRGGRCEVDTCSAGFADCDMNPTNGCEVNTRTDLMNCGTCRHVCPAPPNASAACATGMCGLGACNVGFGNCDMNAANGCEVNTNTTLAHCGECRRACAPANATGVCAAGACGVANCIAGFADCDMNPTNGCEVNTRTDLMNCGTCRHVCPAPPNASAACATGMCGLGACNVGFGNCDPDVSNGCETDLMTTLRHCGRCSNSCVNLPGVVMTELGTSCRMGECFVRNCLPDLGNCDGDAGTGCEADLTGDATNCGACGTRCMPGRRCMGGECR